MVTPTKPADIKPVSPVDRKPEVKPLEVKPVEVKPIDTKPEEKVAEVVKPIDTKPEEKAVDVKPVDTKPEEKVVDVKPIVTKQEEKPVDIKPIVTKQEEKPVDIKVVEPQPINISPVLPKPEVKQVEIKPIEKKPVEIKSVDKKPDPKPTQNEMALNIGGDINADAGLKKLNSFLESRSFVEGWTPSQSDVVVFSGISKAPDAAKYPHARRWYNNIASYKDDERKKFVGAKKSLSDFGVTSGAAAGSKAAAADDDDDFELFGSDEDEEAEKAKAERVKAYQEKKSKKPALIAKSNVILDVKPWDDETDMKALEEAVRNITCEGLTWGVSKLVPLAYGIKKLQIVCVVEDDKVSIDWLQEEIQSNEDLVQSVDIAAFQKI